MLGTSDMALSLRLREKSRVTKGPVDSVRRSGIKDCGFLRKKTGWM